MDFDVIFDSLPMYGQGALVTLALLALSLGFGMLLALPLAMLRSLPSPWAWRPVWAFTYVMRGTPLLVQVFLLYYGLAQFEVVRESALWPLLRSAWFCAVAAFVLNTGAYTTEILYGAMRAVPGGEVEAAKALGMSRWTTFRRIILPSAFRRSLPAYGNEVVLMLHATSLASTVTLYDLTGAAREVNSRFYMPFEAFITAGVCYLLLTFVLVALFRTAEARWLTPLTAR